MSSTEDPPSSEPDDVPTPRPSREPDFRSQTLQSAPAPDDTQERPPFDLAASETPSETPPERRVGPTDRLDAFVAVAAASADRMARSQEVFLNRFARLLEEDETVEVEPKPDHLRSIARDLRILVALVTALVAIAAWSAAWSAGRQSSTPPPPIVVTPPAP